VKVQSQDEKFPFLAMDAHYTASPVK